MSYTHVSREALIKDLVTSLRTAEGKSADSAIDRRYLLDLVAAVAAAVDGTSGTAKAADVKVAATPRRGGLAGKLPR